MVICQLCSIQLQKVKSNPAVKKVCGPQEGQCKKDVKSKVVAKNGCDGRLIAKILITRIKINLVPNHSEMWRRQHKFN